jgi:hypothetical protein
VEKEKNDLRFSLLGVAVRAPNWQEGSNHPKCKVKKLTVLDIPQLPAD